MARKGENIYKRKDGRWEGRYIKISAIDGKKKYGYVYGKSYKEVKEKLLKVRVAREQERIGGNESNATFTFYSAKWFSSLSPDIKESTKNKYQNLLDLYITPNWDDKRLSDIDFDFIDSFCNGLLSSGGKKALAYPLKLYQMSCLLSEVFLDIAKTKENMSRVTVLQLLSSKGQSKCVY